MPTGSHSDCGAGHNPANPPGAARGSPLDGGSREADACRARPPADPMDRGFSLTLTFAAGGVACYNGGSSQESIMEFSVWLGFFAASWAISLSPGAGAIAAMSAGLNHGFKRGYFMTIGLILGILTQIVFVGAGLGALIAASERAFAVVKWAGVAYLVYLGIQQWRSPAKPLVAEQAEGVQVTRRQLVMRGWGINAVNPKGTVFLLAVVPQFLNLHQSLGAQYAVIGATLAFTDAVVMAGYTVLAARVLRALRSESHLKAMNRVFGSLFVAAGALLATFKKAA